MAIYKDGNYAIIGDKINYISFGKKTIGVVTKIVDTDDRELKVTPNYKSKFNQTNVAIKAKNCTLLNRKE